VKEKILIVDPSYGKVDPTTAVLYMKDGIGIKKIRSFELSTPHSAEECVLWITNLVSEHQASPLIETNGLGSIILDAYLNRAAA